MEKAAIVTGGGRGLGRVIAERLARDFAVLVVGRTETDLAATCAAIEASGGKAAYLVGNVGIRETATVALGMLQEKQWEVAALVCNAGVGKSRPTHEVDDAEWKAILDTNLNGSFYFSRAVLPTFVANKNGVLCFISSVAGMKGYAYEAAYSASKHAVVGLSETIAFEYGKHGITSVALCPNFIEGEMTDRVISSLAARRSIPFAEAHTVIERLNPQRRILTAEEVAEMVQFVCSNKVPSLNGSTLPLGNA